MKQILKLPKHTVGVTLNEGKVASEEVILCRFKSG